MFEILNVSNPKPTTQEQLLYLHCRTGSLVIRDISGQWHEAYIWSDITNLDWREIDESSFDDGDTMEEVLEIQEMENITEHVTIRNAVEVWFDSSSDDYEYYED